MSNQGAIQNAEKTRAVAASNGGKKTMKDFILQMEPEIKKALPSVMTSERFTRIILSCLSTTPKLAETTPQSFLGAMMTAAQLGLEPNTPLGHSFLVPRWNGKTKALECVFQFGYKGILDLAYRSGEIKVIQAHVVYENDEFYYSYGFNPDLRHIPARKDRGNPTDVYAVFHTMNGGCGFGVMSIEDVKKHAEIHCPSYMSGAWQTNFKEMAKKTILTRVLKYAPLKAEFARSLSSDETVKTSISDDMFSVQSEYVEINGENYAVDADTGEINS